MINRCPNCKRGGLATRTSYQTEHPWRQFRCRWCRWFGIKFYTPTTWPKSHLYTER